MTAALGEDAAVSAQVHFCPLEYCKRRPCGIPHATCILYGLCVARTLRSKDKPRDASNRGRTSNHTRKPNLVERTPTDVGPTLTSYLLLH